MTTTSIVDTLVTAEVFGPTIQGEGPSAGRRAGFVRLGGCDLHCSWCDTPYTWDASRHDLRAELARRPVDEIAERALAGGVSLVVITGGEPLLHQRQPGWRRLLEHLRAQGVDVEVETNGTRAPTTATRDLVTRLTVSPKLASAGDLEADRVKPVALASLLSTGKAVFKFVCRNPGDVAEAARLAADHCIPKRLVWVMPEGVDTDTLLRHLRSVAEPAIAAGFNLTTRLHTLVWGDERSR